MQSRESLVMKRSLDYVSDMQGPIGSVKFGIPGQDVPVIFDIGCSRTWVSSKICPFTRNSGNMTRFEQVTNQSSKAKPKAASDQNHSFHQSLCEDYISFGSWKCEKPISVEVANHQQEYYGNISGSIGLSPNSTFLHQILDALKARDPFALRSFSLLLSQHRHRNSSITFGGWNNNCRRGTIHWFYYKPAADANRSFFWSLPNVRVRWGQIISDPLPAILDSGSPYIVGPENVVYSMLEHIGADARGRIPCNLILSVPALHIIIQNTTFRIAPRIYIQVGLSGCHVPIKPAYNASKWILGTTFMKNYLTILSFDYPAGRQLAWESSNGLEREAFWVGLAEIKDPTQGSEWYSYANFYIYSGAVVIAIVIAAFYYLYRLIRFITPPREEFPVSPSGPLHSPVTTAYPIPKTPFSYSADAPFGLKLRRRTEDGFVPVSPAELSRLQSQPAYLPVLAQIQSAEMVRSVQIPNLDPQPSGQIGRRTTSVATSLSQTDFPAAT